MTHIGTMAKKVGVLFGFCSGLVQLWFWCMLFRWGFGWTKDKANQNYTWNGLDNL